MDIEKSLLSHVVERDSFQKIWNGGVKPIHFSDPLNQKVFEFSIQYWLDSRMEKVPTREVLEDEWTGFQYEEPEESVTWLIEKLLDKYKANRVKKIVRQAAEELTSDDDPSLALSTLYRDSWEVSRDVAPRSGKANLATNIMERRQRFENKAINKDTVRGVGLGLPEIDRETNGLLKGELATIAGFAKTGKSFALGKIAVEARKAGEVPYLATLELNVDDFSDRLDAIASGVSYPRLQKADLTQDEIKTLHQTQDEMAEMGPLYVERPPRGERTVQYIVNRARQLGATVLLIDQLSFLEPRGTYYNDKKAMVDEIIPDLKNEISEDAEGALPCYLAVQFNRASRMMKGGRGSMEHIGLSSVVEQTVDIAYGLARPQEYRVNNSLLFDIMGSRRSDISSWLLRWELSEDATAIEVRHRLEDSEE